MILAKWNDVEFWGEKRRYCPSNVLERETSAFFHFLKTCEHFNRINWLMHIRRMALFFILSFVAINRTHSNNFKSTKKNLPWDRQTDRQDNNNIFNHRPMNDKIEWISSPSMYSLREIFCNIGIYSHNWCIWKCIDRVCTESFLVQYRTNTNIFKYTPYLRR